MLVALNVTERGMYLVSERFRSVGVLVPKKNQKSKKALDWNRSLRQLKIT